MSNMDFLTLEQLNRLIADNLKLSFPDSYWIMAEMSDVRINYSSGHCYLEFIQKNEHTGVLIAKARAYIWKNTFQVLKPYFEQTTGQAFVSGLKVLVQVGIDFHEIYGYGLTVYDIDPAYTLGDMQRRRQEIIRQLENEGVLDLNKELKLSDTPQRIAVITSLTAAGYEDFMEHLMGNKSGFVFYPKIFPAIMQGEQTEASIISALDKIYSFKDHFDLVVIIRGGGASSDLSSFDSYLLAANCAQFPLPIITGIGHERDDTVLDIVAYKRIKTPTAVADFLIEKMQEAYDELTACQNIILKVSQSLLDDSAAQLQKLLFSIPDKVFSLIEKQRNKLEISQKELKHTLSSLLTEKGMQLNEKEAFLKLSSPEYILSKGYSITRKDGHVITSVNKLSDGDKINIQFADGEIDSQVLS